MLFWGCVNLAISVVFFVMIKAPLMRAYLILSFVLLINPAFMWGLFGAAHAKFIPGGDSYIVALVFIAAFHIVLCTSFIGLMRTLPRARLARRGIVQHRVNDSTDVTRIAMVTILLAVIGFTGKVGMEAMGAFRMLDGGGSGPFLQLLKVFAGFDVLAVIFLGEMRLAQKRRQGILNTLLLVLLMASVVAALTTGSRSQTLTVLIIAMLAYRDKVRQHWYLVYPPLLLVVPLLFYVFPLLGYYRQARVTLAEAWLQLEQSEVRASEIMVEVLVTRLNYLETVARAIGIAQFQGPRGGSVYWNNVIGIIPRAIWPGKPEITNNSRELGHQLGLLTLDDESTSVGLHLVGEAFYEYGWLGLWVAVFQALLFTMIHKNFFYPGRPAAMAVYTFACFNILQRDGYFAVVPGLIWLIIGVTCFFWAYSLLLRQPRIKTPYDPVPHRFTH